MKKQRAWLYCRIAHSSSDDFEMGIQVEYLKRFAAQHDYICGGVTREYGSGTTLNRPGLEELSKALSDGGVENVIVKDLSRLARGYQLTCEYIQALGEQGVGLIAVNEQMYFGKDREHFWAEKSECSYSIFQML